MQTAPLAPRRTLEFGIYRDGDNNLDALQEAAVSQALALSRRDPAIAFAIEDTGTLITDRTTTDAFDLADGVKRGETITNAKEMSDPKTLAAFVAHTLDQAEASGAAQTWIDLVDHGGGDGGGLQTSDGHVMPMPQIANAISEGLAIHAHAHPEDASRRVDGVVANQCLMATLGFTEGYYIRRPNFRFSARGIGREVRLRRGKKPSSPFVLGRPRSRAAGPKAGNQQSGVEKLGHIMGNPGLESGPGWASELFATLCAERTAFAFDDGRQSDRPTVLQRLCQRLPPLLSARISHSITACCSPRPGQVFVTRTITNALYSYRTGDTLADQVRMCGYWDWRNLAIAAVFCAPGDRIIEIGANTGTETVGFAKIVGPQGRVYAFEPQPTLSEVVRHNVRLNGFSNVFVLGAAVTDQNGSVYFKSPVGDNSGIGHITVNTDECREAVLVSAIAIDSIANNLGPATFMAVDVEGHEVCVLRGAGHYLRRHRPAMVLEVCPNLLKKAGNDLGQLMAELKAVDYKPFEIGKFGIRDVGERSRTDPMYAANWLCLPSERAVPYRRILATFLRCSLTPNVAGLHPLGRP